MTRRGTTFFTAAVLVAATAVVGTAQQEDIERLRVLADAGDVEAQFELGQMHARGNGVPQDYRKAFEMFEQSANRGHVASMYYLGLIMAGDIADFTGQAAVPVEPRNWDEIKRWWEKAANNGFAEAQLRLGNLSLIPAYDQFAPGYDGPADFVVARFWFHQAAAQRVAEAQYWLGLLYTNGDGGERNDVLAHMWFALAAQEMAEAEIGLNQLSGRMTASQIAEAQRLAREWDEANPREPEPPSPLNR
jgi:TPR repeat protein